MVLVGEEWHGGPDVVLVNVRKRWSPDIPIRELVAGVRAEGGATFVAHPWSKVARPMEELFDAKVDGLEVVNGVIRARAHIVRKAVAGEKSLLGVIDYKYGPHVNALTLIPARFAETPAGVVEAIRTRRTRVLYAVPGKAMTGEQWASATLGTSGAFAGLRTLLETPLKRRLEWFLVLALFPALWWVATRKAPRRRMGARVALPLFFVCCAIELAIPAALSWQFRAAFGSAPVLLLLAIAALVAVPLIAATHSLSEGGCIRDERRAAGAGGEA